MDKDGADSAEAAGKAPPDGLLDAAGLFGGKLFESISFFVTFQKKYSEVSLLTKKMGIISLLWLFHFLAF